MKYVVSGAIGLTILEKNDNKIFLFYDDHSSSKYCENDVKLDDCQYFFINELFIHLEKTNNYAFILEEPFIDDDGSSIKILWESVEHLKLFRKYYSSKIKQCTMSNICDAFPVDVRPGLFNPYSSFEQMLETMDEENVTMINYFNNILYLFDLSKTCENNTVIFLKNIFFQNTVYYKKLKADVVNFMNKFIDTPYVTIGQTIQKYKKSYSSKHNTSYPYIITHDENDFLERVEVINTAIMEYYSILLLIGLPKQNKIFYGGFFHSENICNVLKKYYKFTEIFRCGKTNFDTLHHGEHSCVTVTTSYFI